jgi:hypothetical protein
MRDDNADVVLPPLRLKKMNAYHYCTANFKVAIGLPDLEKIVAL